MFRNEDKTFHQIREKSVMAWLDEMRSHEDIEVRGGVTATQGYIEALQQKIQVLEAKNETKDRYLKQMKTNKANKA